MRFPGTAFPIPSNCHPGPCGLKVHHEIRDPKALCASKNEASKAHSLGALLNSDSATRRSAERSPKDTQRATSAVSTGSPGLTAALRLPIDRDFAALVLVKPGDDIEENLHNPTAPLPPPAAAQDFAPAKSPAREQTQAGRRCLRKTRKQAATGTAISRRCLRKANKAGRACGNNQSPPPSRHAVCGAIVTLINLDGGAQESQTFRP
jgi:hypothetical protein